MIYWKLSIAKIQHGARRKMRVDKKVGFHRISSPNGIVSSPSRALNNFRFSFIHFFLSLLIRWYFKSIRRIDAEKQLMSDVNEHGSFLVCRRSLHFFTDGEKTPKRDEIFQLRISCSYTLIGYSFQVILFKNAVT